MAIYHGTDASLKADIQNKGLTLVSFWAPWCRPCQMFAPILEAYGAEEKRRVKIIKMNVDENKDTFAKFGIRSIPAVILFKDGKPVDKEFGLLSKERLKQFVDRHQ
ncbi:thioredoxin [Shimazuella sp. AN120528]|uniref:thioredoxin n=1 Tax=Shimazuella soli TaxID=1892854 RepID=UPI001F0D4882|nr:thioredoxin [Shimazuella soli]MCH5585175.1 thioredoxin [Shimazuella soli]